MERRLFLTGLLGLAGATAAATVLKPAEALAGMPSAGRGILDEIDAPEVEGDAVVEPVWHRGVPHAPNGGRRRRRRRRVWRRVCERYRRNGRWYTRCVRRRVWVWFYI